MKGDEARCLEAGCSGYLAKPIDQDQLLGAVAAALRTGAAAEHAVGLTAPAATRGPVAAAPQPKMGLVAADRRSRVSGGRDRFRGAVEGADRRNAQGARGG